jgi:hypothetical protein
MTKKPFRGKKRYVLLTVMVVMAIFASISFGMCYIVLKAEAYARYMGVRNVSAEKVAKIIRGVEQNANNIFDEVKAHHDTPDEVIEALKSKVNLNYDVRGYFAAFEPNYFPEKGTWFEPYIYQPEQGGFEYKQVGSARHNYMKSPWYVHAKATGKSFWSSPYYYYDGTSISGHYCTFIKPIYDANGKLECVCGADMKFEWLAKELEWVDNSSKTNKLLNKYHWLSDFKFYSIILNNDGTCIVHPGEGTLTITNQDVIRDLGNRQGGVAETRINGEDCTIYYGPIEFVDWSIAVVAPRWDVLKPMMPVAAVLLFLAFVGLVAVGLTLRK